MSGFDYEQVKNPQYFAEKRTHMQTMCVTRAGKKL